MVYTHEADTLAFKFLYQRVMSCFASARPTPQPCVSVLLVWRIFKNCEPVSTGQEKKIAQDAFVKWARESSLFPVQL